MARLAKQSLKVEEVQDDRRAGARWFVTPNSWTDGGRACECTQCKQVTIHVTKAPILKPYFPCYPYNGDSVGSNQVYHLGRAFLQGAFLAQNWQRLLRCSGSASSCGRVGAEYLIMYACEVDFQHTRPATYNLGTEVRLRYLQKEKVGG